MRGYRLNDTSWSRLVTARVRRPQTIATRLGSRRRRELPVPVDGRIVLLDGARVRDPDGAVVDRRQMLDRLVEALSVDGVDGVFAPADVLEELTMLNVLERRLAVCEHVAPEAAARAGFDAFGLRVGCGEHGHAAEMVAVAHRNHIGAVVSLERPLGEGTDDYDTAWRDWIDPIRSLTGAVTAGEGVWLTLPGITGLNVLADLSTLPVLVRDTEVALGAGAWQQLFSQGLPLTVRGMLVGASALFPDGGDVAAATAAIVQAVRRPV